MVNDQITTRRLMFSIGTFIFSTSFLSSTIYIYTKHESWINVILAFVLSLPIIAMYVFLAKKYPGMSLTQINELAFGKIAGKIISLMYLFFFLMLTLLNTFELGVFVSFTTLPSTPRFLIVAIFVFVCAMAVRRGSQKITNISFLLLYVSAVVVVFNSILLINNYRLTNLLPLFTMPYKDYLKGIHYIDALPLCNTIAFLMLLPDCDKSANIKKSFFGGILLGSVFMLALILRDIAVLGPHITLAARPPYAVIRQIDVFDIFQRLEILYAFIVVCLFFFKISILYFASVSSLGQILSVNRKILITIVGVFLIVYSQNLFNAPAEHSKWLQSAAATFSTFFEVLIPLVTVIAITLRQTGQKKPVVG